MISEKKQEMKKWISTWQIASLALKKFKKNDLRSPDYYEKNRKTLEDMLQYACEHAKPRLKSGLTEQQRLFMKMRHKNH